MLKNYTRTIVNFSALAVLLLICSCQIGLATGSSVSVSPQTITASPQERFTVEIIVDPAGSEVFGAECTIHFDNTILKAIEQSKGDFLSQDGAETIEVANNINNELGVVEYGETRLGDPEIIGGATDSGVLASITFEAIGSGRCDLELESILADAAAQEIDAVVNAGTCIIEGEGVTVTVTNTETPVSTEPESTSSVTETPGFVVFSVIIGLFLASFLICNRRFR